jgi:hypothetical protein
MNINEHNSTLDHLEAIIDKHELTGLCNLIAEVCSAKADHIADNWQDEALACVWDEYAAFFIKASLSPDHCKLRQEDSHGN